MNMMTSHQAAEFLGLPETTLRYWRMRGEGPPYLKLGRAVRYKKEDLNSWIDDQTKDTSPPESGGWTK